MDKLQDNRSDKDIDDVDQKPKCRLPWRYTTALIGFYAMFNSYTLRTHLSVTMVAMVNSTTPTNQATSCSSNDSSTPPSNDIGGPFNWDSEMQGILFGGFYWGYIIPQIWSGRMAEIYGPNRIVFVGGLIATAATAIGPLAANVNVWFFFFTRVVCGLGLAVFTPCLHSLIAKWTPPNERSRLSAFVYSGCHLGVIVSMPVTGIICQNSPDDGWSWPFYVFAIISGIWLVLWFFLVADSPAQNKWISKSEKDMIERKLDNAINDGKPKSLPYKHLLKSKPFWGLLWTHFGNNWGFYTLLTQIPTYMSDILHFDIQQNGAFSAVPYVVLMLFGYFCSILADYLIKRDKMSVTNVRKTFQTIALGGSALFLLVITFLNCQTMAIYSMLVLSVGFTGATFAGYQINQVDLSPNFAGSLQGITNTVGCIPGIISPYITGIITSNSDTQQGWSIIFYISIGVLVIATIEYIIFGSGELQYWNDLDSMKNNNISNGNTSTKVSDTNALVDAVIVGGDKLIANGSK